MERPPRGRRDWRRLDGHRPVDNDGRDRHREKLDPRFLQPPVVREPLAGRRGTLRPHRRWAGGSNLRRPVCVGGHVAQSRPRRLEPRRGQRLPARHHTDEGQGRARRRVRSAGRRVRRRRGQPGVHQRCDHRPLDTARSRPEHLGPLRSGPLHRSGRPRPRAAGAGQLPVVGGLLAAHVACQYLARSAVGRARRAQHMDRPDHDQVRRRPDAGRTGLHPKLDGEVRLRQGPSPRRCGLSERVEARPGRCRPQSDRPFNGS